VTEREDAQPVVCLALTATADSNPALLCCAGVVIAAALFDCIACRGVIIPPLPEKNAVQKFQMSTEFIEDRRRALQVGTCLMGLFLLDSLGSFVSGVLLG
jgi:hypothetical protein